MGAAPLTAEEEALREDLAEVRLDRDAVQALHSDALELLTAARAEIDAAWQATGVASTVRGLTTLADVVTTLRESAAELRAERSAAVEGPMRELAMTRYELVVARIGIKLYTSALERIEAALGLTGASMNETMNRLEALRRERDEAVEALAKLRADAGTVVSDLHRANQLSREVRQVGIEALETEIAEVRREKAELAARVDGAVARADLLRDVARHERDVYAHVIARLRDVLRLETSASISDVVKRAEELAALQVGTP